MSDFFPASNYPGIFSTHQWIDAWHSAWSDCEAINAVCTHLNTDACRLGFYQYQQRKLGAIKFTTLFPSGVSTQASPSLRSEYFHLGAQSAEDFLKLACSFNWDQLYIPDVLLNSSDYQQICAVAKSMGLSVLPRDSAVSYAVQLCGNSFSDYLKSLSGSTRLKLFNKRKKLHEIGEVAVRNLWPDLSEFIVILNQFHLQRWGRPCYQGRNLKQIVTFLQQISNDGGEPDLSVIYCNGAPVSAVLDLRYRGRIYNIQSGYLEKFQDGISLGTLHFGFQLEKAFSSGALFYDFMAGNGKNANYKQSIATHHENFISLMIVRKPLMQLLYRLKDARNSFARKK
jgi:hypothetical protein